MCFTAVGVPWAARICLKTNPPLRGLCIACLIITRGRLWALWAFHNCQFLGASLRVWSGPGLAPRLSAAPSRLPNVPRGWHLDGGSRRRPITVESICHICLWQKWRLLGRGSPGEHVEPVLGASSGLLAHLRLGPAAEGAQCHVGFASSPDQGPGRAWAPANTPHGRP